ncbi:unnamed protein product [Toxocara canis]|uniref:Uncharacterized protein n=1 Tax=Toxocara canis TaxID=6265 RepID=A0A183V5W3_TOXCA|nr:unnamed protein product [Toxocara canis]
MAYLVSTLCILLLGVLASSRGTNAHRLCGFKLAKIIRQVCEVAECNWDDELVKMEIDDERGSEYIDAVVYCWTMDSHLKKRSRFARERYRDSAEKATIQLPNMRGDQLYRRSVVLIQADAQSIISKNGVAEMSTNTIR